LRTLFWKKALSSVFVPLEVRPLGTVMGKNLDGNSEVCFHEPIQLARTRHGISTGSFFAATLVFHHVAAPGEGRAPYEARPEKKCRNHQAACQRASGI
jgi:hypothetical protein